MLTLQEVQRKAEEMDEILKPILLTLSVDTEAESDETKILGLHESATKLWLAVMRKKGQDDLDSKIASALIGIMLLAKHFKVKNLEESYLKRIDEIINDNKKASAEAQNKKSS